MINGWNFMIAHFESHLRENRFIDFCEMVQYCTLCPRLCDRPKVMSTNNGNICSKVLFVAEAPGRLGADRTGIPLFGDKTGNNFESLLGNIGWNRGDIFITNSLLCNPREENGNNGTPKIEEIENCSTFLEMTIELIQPEVIVSLGIVALKALDSISPHGLTLKQDAANPTSWNDRLLIPLYHPGPRAILHRSLAKQRSDFMALAKIIHPIKGIIDKHPRSLPPKFKEKGPALPPIDHLVCTIVKELGRITYFKLTKLLYMADLLALEKLGRTITGEIYLRQVDGPWPPSLKDCTSNLSDHEIVFYSTRSVPFVAPGTNPRFVPKLHEEDESILAEILGKYAHYTNSQIKTAVYRTKPMRYLLEEEKKGRNMRKVPVIYQDKTSIQIDDK